MKADQNTARGAMIISSHIAESACEWPVMSGCGRSRDMRNVGLERGCA